MEGALGGKDGHWNSPYVWLASKLDTPLFFQNSFPALKKSTGNPHFVNPQNNRISQTPSHIHKVSEVAYFFAMGPIDPKEMPHPHRMSCTEKKICSWLSDDDDGCESDFD